MKDVIKVAERAERFGRIEFDEISLRSDLRALESRPYETPSSVIRRVMAELHYLREREETLHVLGQIKKTYL